VRRSTMLVLALALAACGEANDDDDDGGDTPTDSGVGETTATTRDPASDAASDPSAAETSSAPTSAAETTSSESADTTSDDSTGGGDGSGLAIDGDRFTFDGAPTFLLGVSYFDARDWSTSDFDGLSQRGWNLVRIWLDWSDDGFFGPDATLSPDGASALVELVAAARERDMVVDVTILDPEFLVGPDVEHRSAAVASVATTLADANNVLFDVMNEHDHSGGPIDHAEAGVIVAAVRAVDPDRIVTISSTGGHLVADDATVQTTAVDEELDVVGIDVVTPHLPRTADWSPATGPRVTSLRAHLRTRGITMPIYLQEDARRGHSGLDPSAEEFIGAAQAAVAAGAAGWIFHTDAGFELGTSDFFGALDEVEAIVVDTLPDTL
jgi:hypothetical protein